MYVLSLSPPHTQINAEKAPYLTDKLKVWMLPTLALIKNEKVVDYVVGFDDLGGKDDFTTGACGLLGVASVALEFAQEFRARLHQLWSQLTGAASQLWGPHWVGEKGWAARMTSPQVGVLGRCQGCIAGV